MTSTYKHKTLYLLLFWTLVFILNLGPDWQKYASTRELIEVGGLTTLLQWLVYWVAIKYLVPQFIDQDKHRAFVLLFLLVVFVATELFVLISYLYLEPTYPASYGAFYVTKLSEYTLIERLGFSNLIKYIVIAKLPALAFPAIILMAVNFYEKQRQLLTLKEQKQAAELNALKNQLNPHFIFNTLNNIYSMAISGSSHTAEAVAKLSGIFDYVLYQCNERFVDLTAEIEMIENYIALERLRFGDRVKINFSHQVHAPASLAPLLYLSLVENAFKHGVEQELGEASIDIQIVADHEQIEFTIKNSVPVHQSDDDQSNSIGSDNLIKQLALLYPDSHEYTTHSSANSFQASLKLSNQSRSRQ